MVLSDDVKIEQTDMQHHAVNHYNDDASMRWVVSLVMLIYRSAASEACHSINCLSQTDVGSCR